MQSEIRNPQFEIPISFIDPAERWTSIGLKELWQYRELLYFLTWRDIKVRYKQTALGAAWAIIQPVFMMMVFSLFFGRFAKVPSDGIPYPVFVFCALLPWQLFAHALTESSNSLVANERLITKVYFSRLVVPISAVLGGLVDFAIAFVIACHDALLRHRSDLGDCYSAGVPVAGSDDCIGSWPLAFGAKRSVPRRALYDQPPHSILAFCYACRLSKFDCSSKMARAVRTESHGRCSRRLSLGAAGKIRCTGRLALGFGRCRYPAADRWSLLLPANGAGVRGCSLNQVMSTEY